MDTPENSTQATTDEIKSNESLDKKDSKSDSLIQNCSEIPNSTSYEHSDNLFNVPVQTIEFENQLIMKEEMADQDQSNVHSESVESSIDENVKTQEVVEEIPVVQENFELEGISIQGEIVDQVIVTTLSEVISCENDSMITTTCSMALASCDNKIEGETPSIPKSSNIDGKVDSEQNISNNAEGNIADSSNSELHQSLPSFIGEVDESVSLPPAEPLILEQENIPHDSVLQAASEGVEEIVTEGVSLNEIAIENLTDNEIITDNSMDSEIVTDNTIESETVGENMIENEIVTEDSVVNEIITDNSIESEIITDNSIESETIDENITENETEAEHSIDSETDPQNINQNEIVTENVTMDEIELAEAPQTEIITSGESNIQYTVLPPGENSVYQEDGTLVVEYPLDTTGVMQNETVEVEKNLTKDEGNIIEMVEAPSEDEAGTSSKNNDDTNVKKAGVPDKPQPKPKGRKTAGGIPPHIVGHTIDKPVQDVPNGKGLKPRLGVKIPYRKLASQIVSTTELENRIVERARLKEESRYESEKTNQFTKQLTHRLAQSLSGLSKKASVEKIKPEADSNKAIEGDIQIIENMLAVIPTSEGSTELQPTNPIEFVEQMVNEETVVSESKSPKVSETGVHVPSTGCIENAEIIFADNANHSTNIENNSDLIAILEGDGDETSIMNVPNVVEIVDTSDNSSVIKAIEKEMSLTEQKMSNPVTPQVKEKKFFKSRESRVAEVAKEKAKEISKPKPNVINITSNTQIMPVKKEEPGKTNIFDSESTSVSKSVVKSADLKKQPNVQEMISDVKGKNSGFVIEVEPQLKPAMVLKTYTRKRKSNDIGTPEPPKKPLIMPPPPNKPDPKIDCVTPIPPNVYVTKSSRVIKKKVIWDPDEAMPSVRNQSKILSKIEATAKTTPPTKGTAVQKQMAVKTTEKKVAETKQTEQPKITRAVEKKMGKTVQDEKEKKNVIEKTPVKKLEKGEIAKKITAKNPVAEKTTPQNKIIITSMKISSGKSPKRTAKRLSEIDRLLMDEGAVNMLYDINNSDDQKRRVSGRTGVAPTEKAQNQKELLNRTQEIKNELTQGTGVVASTPKVLRKKEGPPLAKKEMLTPAPVSRKMSKDSTKSSVHSPPPSPAAFTPAEASRIIRRHSSSSFSSNEGIVQDESVISVVAKEKQVKKKEVPVEKIQKPATNIDVTPVTEQSKGKVIKKRPIDTPEVTPKKKPKLQAEEPVLANGEPSKPTEIVIKSEPGIVTGALKTDPTKAFTVIKMNRHYMINLTYFGGENYMTVQLLKDLIVTLKELERTRNCSVVSICSQGPAFCLGIDYKELVESDEQLRNKKHTEMSNWIREFLKCLLNFSKIIVAGVKGDCTGFGVTMLPLFDMIVATDTASFCTPYAKIGCPPEAGFLLSIPYQSNHGLASELLYTAQRMNADEAQRRGLVTKLFWPEKFDSEFRALLSHISNLSKPALMTTKKQLKRVRCQNTEMEINANSKLLVRFWGSEECQNSFVNYNALTFDIDH